MGCSYAAVLTRGDTLYRFIRVFRVTSLLGAEEERVA